MLKKELDGEQKEDDKTNDPTLSVLVFDLEDAIQSRVEVSRYMITRGN